ncbi:MAG: hypothetical protein JHC71_09725, partial [Blastococcus sp.]|nr:hypothetical protein [Blastococcus sp.]
MPGGPATRSSIAVLPGQRADGPSWTSRLLLAVLAVVGFAILLTALSPEARAEDGPGKSASAPGRATDGDEPTIGDTWEEPPDDPSPDAPPASEPDEPLAQGEGEHGDEGASGSGQSQGGDPVDGAGDHANGGGSEEPVELPVLPVVPVTGALEPLPLPPLPLPLPPLPAPVSTGDLGQPDTGGERPTSVVAVDDAESTVLAATAVDEAPT